MSIFGSQDILGIGRTVPFSRYKGRISFTFDDGYDEHATVASVFNAAGEHATFYVDGNVDKSGYLTSAQVLAMSKAGHEIGCHHSGYAAGKTTIEGIIGKKCTSYAYPGGAYTEISLKAILGLFKYGRTIEYGHNCKFTLPQHLHCINSTTTSTDETVQQIKQEMLLSRLTGSWCISNFHEYGAGELTEAHLADLIAFAQAIGIDITIVSEGATEAIEPIMYWRPYLVRTHRIANNLDGGSDAEIIFKGIHRFDDLTISGEATAGAISYTQFRVAIMSDGRNILVGSTAANKFIHPSDAQTGYAVDASSDGKEPYPLSPMAFALVRGDADNDEYVFRCNMPFTSYGYTRIKIFNSAAAGNTITVYASYRISRPLAQMAVLDRLTF